MRFRWNAWNRDHVAQHGVESDEAEQVVRQARRRFPEEIGDEKFLVMGPGHGGRLLQVIYLLDPDNTIFVIHARPLSAREKQRYRRRIRP